MIYRSSRREEAHFLEAERLYVRRHTVKAIPRPVTMHIASVILTAHCQLAHAGH